MNPQAVMNGSPATDPRYEEAKALHEQGRHTEAAALLEELLAAEAGNVAARYALGVCLTQLGRAAQAQDQFRAVLAVYPTHYEAAYRLGRLLEGGGRYEEAATAYRRVVAVTDFEDAKVRLRDCEAALMQLSPPPPPAPALDGAAPPPLRKTIEASHVAGRGRHISTLSLQPQHLIPSVAKALLILILVDQIPDVAVDIARMFGVAIGGATTRYGARAYGDAYAYQTTAAIFGTPIGMLWDWTITLLCLWVVATIALIPLKSLMYRTELYEYGMDVATGIRRRSRQFIWYYQITEPPTYVRRLTSYATHTASLRISYNNTASTVTTVELPGIGSPARTIEVRDYLQSRVPPERLPIRGPWT